MHPHIHYTLSLFLSAESRKSFHHRLPPGMSRKCMAEVMATLHGSAPSLQRRVGGCVPPEGTIAPTRDPFKSPLFF